MKRIFFVLNAILGIAAGAAAATHAGMNMDASSDPQAAVSTGDGSWPTIDDALHHLDRHAAIFIHNASGFSPANGVRSGNGTQSDPYVIADIYTPSLTIRDVEASITIRHVYVSGALVLDWTGAGANVLDSFVGELDTNTNRAHRAPATWGSFTGDRIGAAVLRHQGGAFAGNDIGPEGPTDSARLTLNVEGYNGLRVANNTVRGPTEFRLHGHHFSDSPADAWMPMDMMGNGSAEDRYHELVIVDNRFLDPTGRGVSISDVAHAANDRTANSEPDAALNGTHRHFTSITFDRNEVQGAGIVIDHPDAPDKHHEPGGITTISLASDTVTDPLGGVAVRIVGSHGANLTLAHSELRMSGEVKGSTGVLLESIDGGSVTIKDVTIQGFETGIRASHVTKTTSWSVTDTRFVDDGREIGMDASVKSKPSRTPDAA